MNKLIITLILLIISTNTISAGNVKIWDTNVGTSSDRGEINGKLYYDIRTSLAWANRANWVQVPYGTVGNYNFIGDPIIDNGIFYLFLQSCNCNSPIVYPIIDGTPALYVELYGSTVVNGYNEQNMYPDRTSAHYRTIVKNTPDEVIYYQTASYTAGRNVIQYRVKSGNNWIEQTPLTNTDYYFDIHSSPNWFAAAPPSSGSGTDIVIDPKYIEANTTGYIDHKHIVPSTHPFVLQQLMMNPGGLYPRPWNAALVIPKVRTSDNLWIYSGRSVSQEIRLMTVGSKVSTSSPNNAMYIGVMNHPWSYGAKWMSPISVTAGQKIIGNSTIPYSGIWRISGRIGNSASNDVYYTNSVNLIAGSPIYFTTPVSGTLNSLSWYLYDRTPSTPVNIKTAMDIYLQTKGINPVPTTTPTPVVTTPSPTPTISPTPTLTIQPTPVPTPPIYSDPLADLVAYLSQILQFLFSS